MVADLRQQQRIRRRLNRRAIGHSAQQILQGAPNLFGAGLAGRDAHRVAEIQRVIQVKRRENNVPITADFRTAIAADPQQRPTRGQHRMPHGEIQLVVGWVSNLAGDDIRAGRPIAAAAGVRGLSGWRHKNRQHRIGTGCRAGEICHDDRVGSRIGRSNVADDEVGGCGTGDVAAIGQVHPVDPAIDRTTAGCRWLPR